MKLNIDGININYIQEGKGYDIILLHGWGGSIETMNPIFLYFRNFARVTSIDLPGFGESDKPIEAINSYEYSDIIYKFIREIGIEEANIIGHSHGGRIGIILAAQHSDIVNKLVLVNSAGIIPKRTFKYYIKIYWFKALKKLYMLLNKNNEDNLEKFYKKFGSTDYSQAEGVMRQTMVKVVNDNLEPLLEKIKTPTLLVWGENDEDTPLYMGKIMEEKIKDSGLVIIENGTHYSYIDDIVKFKAAVKYFFKDELS
ncbi:MAG: alpha/beta hydrolase [Bacillota bacterium]|nr:alpha/beta hydrolase [Bacillota bacterium]